MSDKEGKPEPLFAQADATRIPLADDSVDAVIGSPPYAEARTYGVSADREIEAWSIWMADITVESLRVSRGAVVWVVDDQVKNGALRPGVFLLGAELYRRGVIIERPCIWRSNKAPSRHGRWWTHAWEYVFSCKRGPSLPHFDWKVTATEPKYGYAGAFRQRRKDGARPARLREYVAPTLAHPRDIFYAKVGGGHMGHPLATTNEAPYPESLVEQIIPVLVPPNGIVLDPFSGSGTTANVAARLGRRGIGLDLRMSQCLLGRERYQTPYTPKAKKTKREAVIFGESLFTETPAPSVTAKEHS